MDMLKVLATQTDILPHAERLHYKFGLMQLPQISVQARSAGPLNGTTLDVTQKNAKNHHMDQGNNK